MLTYPSPRLVGTREPTVRLSVAGEMTDADGRTEVLLQRPPTPGLPASWPTRASRAVTTVDWPWWPVTARRAQVVAAGAAPSMAGNNPPLARRCADAPAHPVHTTYTFPAVLQPVVSPA